MNVYLKSAVQNLDCHIAALQEMRDRLAEGVPGPVIGVTVFAPGPVQTLEQTGAKSKVRGPKAKVKTRNGGGRSVKAEVQTAREDARPTTPGAFQPSTLAGAMKFEIGRLKEFTLEALQTLVNEKYGGEEFYTKAARNSFYGNLAYWAKTGRLEKSGDGAQASFKILDTAFFSQVEFQS